MEKLHGFDILIGKTKEHTDIAWCAELMASNDPWITLKRDHKKCIRLLEDPLSEVYILKNDDEHVGFIMIKIKGPFCGYIQSIVIDEAYRGKGIGEAAIRYIELLIFQTYSNVFLCASSFNQRAQELYQSMGYETIGVLKDYIVKGHDEILMRKTKGPINDFIAE